MAKLCFWYDAEMNSGGHSGYFDCYADENFDKVEKSLINIRAEDIFFQIYILLDIWINIKYIKKG